MMHGSDSGGPTSETPDIKRIGETGWLWTVTLPASERAGVKMYRTYRSGRKYRKKPAGFNDPSPDSHLGSHHRPLAGRVACAVTAGELLDEGITGSSIR
jgi:hypothetical protein